MVDIYIKDSGLLSIPYDSTETSFTTYGSATVQNKRDGEFTIPSALVMKITNMTQAVSNNFQDVLGMKDQRGSSSRISQSPMIFTATCLVDKPMNTFTDVSNRKDLVSYIDMMLMTWSKGYKQLWISDPTDVQREWLFTLYDLISTFGYNDGSLTEGTTDTLGVKRHLKILVKSFTQNEGADTLTYQVTFKIIWDFH